MTERHTDINIHRGYITITVNHNLAHPQESDRNYRERNTQYH